MLTRYTVEPFLYRCIRGSYFYRYNDDIVVALGGCPYKFRESVMQIRIVVSKIIAPCRIDEPGFDYMLAR